MKRYLYTSKNSRLFTEIIFIILGVILYIAFGAIGTIGIAILLLWIVHNYKYEKCVNVYELYDIVNKRHIAYIHSSRNFRKGEIVCCSTIGDWYIEEVNVCVKPLYAFPHEDLVLTHDEERTFCLLKCRQINNLVPEKLLKEEQIEKVIEED